MKIVLAPGSFKGSLSCLEAARAMELGVKSVLAQAETVLAPMADGGDGTLEAILFAQGGTIRETQVQDPLGRPVAARWALLADGRTGVIEMAAASGLTLLRPGERDPRRATTFGTGQLIRAALEEGCRRLIIGLGGSATVDGGAGLAQALGVGLYDGKGRALPPGGAGLARLERVDLSGLDPRLTGCSIQAACDVTNPLLGPRGAARVYGPQKGATPAMVEELELALSRLAEVLKRELGVDLAALPGAGAAGGLGAGLAGFLGAELVEGADLVAEAISLAEKLAGAQLVLTGEGSLDLQTTYGKTPAGVARLAKRFHIPVVALAGSLKEGYQAVYDCGIDAVESIAPGPVTLGKAMREAYPLLAEATARALRLVAVGGRGLL
jgi:glycerate kinase